MTRRARRILFIISATIFLFVGYIAVLYAQGYKYSFSDGRFTRTGAIYLKSNTDAKIYINDRLVGTTSFLGNTFSKSGLLPKQYAVRVIRDGYTSWQKKVTVQEGFVSDFENVLILPESEDETSKIIAEIDSSLYPTQTPSPSISLLKSPTPTPKPAQTPYLKPAPSLEPYYIKNKILYHVISDKPEIITKNVSSFILDDDESRIAWWNENNELWVMWLKDTDYQPHHKQGDIELITRFSTRIKNIAWFRGNNHIVVASLGYKIVELDTRGGINIIKL